jgi:2Fe-2S ferredoxin
MAKIMFITQDNESVELQGEHGSVMALAVENFVEGIDGNCGGVCSCATCHVHVKPEQMSMVGQASEIEQDMLDLDDNANEYSRLCCQIEISDDIDGLVLSVAGD